MQHELSDRSCRQPLPPSLLHAPHLKQKSAMQLQIAACIDEHT